ncbi:hypothetical protein [Halapricum desulfuricans]|nr:hypothetical protein [Halapricum desulfuricans]
MSSDGAEPSTDRTGSAKLERPDSADDDHADDPVEDALDAVRRRGRAVERRELERATARLDAMDGLTDERRRVLAETASAIATGVLAAPLASLSRVDGLDDGELERVESLLTPEKPLE